MAAPQQRLRLHFFGRQADRPVSSLAGALGVGPLARPGGIESKRFDRLAQVAANSFEVVPSDRAELWVYAHDVVDRNEPAAQLARLPADRGHCVFFYSNDDADPIPLEDGRVTIFRTSLFGSTRLPHEQVMPALCDDVLAPAAGQLSLREWSQTPSIGFCGFVGSPVKRLAFRVLGQGQKVDGLDLRERALAILERQRLITTKFVRRRSFWGGSMSRFHFNQQRQEKVRAEFVDNLLSTDYGLCARGKGNFSYRLYEVLSAGRIPVFVNSDCVLPFQGEIDWRSHMVWLEPADLPRCGERILSFHRELGPVGFAELQRKNRQLWVDWLSPEVYFSRALRETMSW